MGERGAPMDLRTYLFEPLEGLLFVADITASEPGVLAGIKLALDRAAELGLFVLAHLSDGSSVEAGACVLKVRGTAEQIARAEEELLGCLGKPSGVAAAACRFATLAGGRARVVCGAWKKAPSEFRSRLREAVEIGGAHMRLLDEPFVYLDKNYVRMFGGISEALGRACSIDGRVVAVQVRGEGGPIAQEAVLAAGAGAGVVMVDTGSVEDLRQVVEALRRRSGDHGVRIAFAGGVTAERFEEAIEAGADIIDIGRAIIDAPLLDFRLDVQARDDERLCRN